MTIYQEYANVQFEIDTLEKQKEVLRKKISAELPEEGYKDEEINAFWTLKKSWKYSPRVDGLTAELKSTKKLEEEDGTATAEETKTLTIRTN